jgi:hypothetical protein
MSELKEKLEYLYNQAIKVHDFRLAFEIVCELRMIETKMMENKNVQDD